MNTKKIYSIASLLVILGFLAMAKIYIRSEFRFPGGKNV